MAAEKEEQAKPKEKDITILNKGLGSFHTKHGILAPGKTLTLPASEAHALLEYPHLVDLSKVAPKQKEQMDALKAENEALKKELAETKELLAKKGNK